MAGYACLRACMSRDPHAGVRFAPLTIRAQDQFDRRQLEPSARRIRLDRLQVDLSGRSSKRQALPSSGSMLQLYQVHAFAVDPTRADRRRCCEVTDGVDGRRPGAPLDAALARPSSDELEDPTPFESRNRWDTSERGDDDHESQAPRHRETIPGDGAPTGKTRSLDRDDRGGGPIAVKMMGLQSRDVKSRAAENSFPFHMLARHAFRTAMRWPHQSAQKQSRPRPKPHPITIRP